MSGRPKGAPRSLYERREETDHVLQSRSWGRKNVYVCDTCGGAITTVDVDEGTTPMFLACRADGSEDWASPDKCKGQMQSQMYPPEPWPERVPAKVAKGCAKNLHLETVWVTIPPVGWEWFKPTGKAYRNLSPEMRDHVDRGGLDLRRRSA